MIRFYRRNAKEEEIVFCFHLLFDGPQYRIWTDRCIFLSQLIHPIPMEYCRVIPPCTVVVPVEGIETRELLASVALGLHGSAYAARHHAAEGIVVHALKHGTALTHAYLRHTHIAQMAFQIIIHRHITLLAHQGLASDGYTVPSDNL